MKYFFYIFIIYTNIQIQLSPFPITISNPPTIYAPTLNSQHFDFVHVPFIHVS